MLLTDFNPLSSDTCCGDYDSNYAGLRVFKLKEAFFVLTIGHISSCTDVLRSSAICCQRLSGKASKCMKKQAS